MATSTAIPTKLKSAQVNGTNSVNFGADTFKVLLVSPGSGAPDTSKTGIQFVQDVISGGNTEVTGTGYARQTLSGVTATFDGTGTTLVDFSFANVTFSQNAAGFTTARYAIFYDNTVGVGDSTHPVIAVCDLGSNQSSQPGDLVLAAPAGGLIQWS